jgi:hypothetical protein
MNKQIEKAVEYFYMMQHEKRCCGGTEEEIEYFDLAVAALEERMLFGQEAEIPKNFRVMYPDVDFSLHIKSEDERRMAQKIFNVIRAGKECSTQEALNILDGAKAIMMECVML